MNMKKGFIFSTDAFLAIILFVLIIFLVYTFSISLSGLNQQYFFSDDLLTVLSNVKISELDLNNYDKINGLAIEDKDVTLAEQIVTFYQKGDTNGINNIVSDVLGKLNKDVKSAIYIGETSVYGSTPSDIDNIISRIRLAVGKK